MTTYSVRSDEAGGQSADDAPSMGSDLLRGADQIADFMFGTPDERRKIYHLAETSKLPVFRLGALLCARKSTLLSWIEAQEISSTNGQARFKA